MIGRIKQSRRAQIVLILALGATYSVIGTGSHLWQGHVQPITTIYDGEPDNLLGFEQDDLPPKLILGAQYGTLTVSLFPGFGIDLGSNLDTAINDWNTALRTPPTSFTFDVLDRIANNDSGADITIDVHDPPFSGCPSAWACADSAEDAMTETLTCPRKLCQS